MKAIIQCNESGKADPSLLASHSLTLSDPLVLDSANEEAFLIGDMNEIRHQYRRWVHCLPRVRPFYGKLG